jgi:parallel beta-helix repeat protein
MPSKAHNFIRTAAGACATAAIALAAFAPAASADVNCTKFASPTGSDSAQGSLDSPYASVEKLSDSLSPGDVGCLRGGTYDESPTVSHGGTASAPVTLTSYPGERAKIVGRFWIKKGADYATVANLDLDGKNPESNPSPTVNANHARFVDNDVTNEHTEICFLLGNDWGTANNTVIESNRIHNCGRMPAANHDHGIYLNAANDTEIIGNQIYDNADRGIQLYPNAQRTHIAGNVIDGNGEGIIFSGAGSDTSNDTVVEDNIITNSNQRNNIESFYPDGTPIGQNNVVRNNCIAGGVRDDNGDGGISDYRQGFTIGSGNVVSHNPKFVDRGAKDYRLQADSPCAGIANAATKSNGTRVTVATPTPSSPTSGNSNPTRDTGSSNPSRSNTRPVSLRMTPSRHGRLRLHGRVRHHKASGVQSADASRTRVLIQIRWSGAWYPLATVRVVNGRFSAKLRVPPNMRGRMLRLRAVVPKVGSSHSVRVRAR